MRKTLLVLLMLSFVITVKAQQGNQPAGASSAQAQTNQQQATPGPSGGNDAFMKYMKRYANHWYNNDKGGSVTLTFTVQKDGSLTDYKITHSLNAEADGIAIQAAKEYNQKWIPAMENGQAVSKPYTVVVPFGGN